MMKNIFLALVPLFCLFHSQAQKRVLNYPFQFEKSILAKSDYVSYFLNNPVDESFAIILKDNRKVEYVWLDHNFKVVSKVSSPIGSTLMDEAAHHYIGGTANGGEYHFIYQIRNSYSMETVDFNGKSVSNKKVLESFHEEKRLAAFSDHNTFYSVAVNDKNGSLSLHIVNDKGELTNKSIPFPIPSDAGRHKDKLSEYLNGLKVVKSSEEPELSTAVKSVKLFSVPGRLTVVVNSADNPSHVFSVDLSDYTVREEHIDYSPLIDKGDKGKVYISSFLKGNHLFSLILNKKSIRISVHDVSSGQLINKFEFTEDAGFNLFAEAPMSEMRMGKQVRGKEVDDIKKVIRAFTRGTEGLMVNDAGSGRVVLTAGTYDEIQMNSGGSVGGHWAGAYQNRPMPGDPGHMEYNPMDHYVPGIPSFTTYSARYYNTTYFKLLLDTANFHTARGRVPRPVADQIKDYIDDTKGARATCQFAIGKNQYFGYYDRDDQAYVVEQIKLY